MHVAADLNWFLQFVVLAFAGAFGLLYLVRNTASRYFVVDSNFDSSATDFSSLDSRKRDIMAGDGGGPTEVSDSCAVCDLVTTKQCAGCKMVKYCSAACQRSHWESGHKTKCKDLQSSYKAFHTKSTSALREKGGSSKIIKQSNKILFPYEEFLEFFNSDKPGYPPCGLLNCGNSCFANVVLQCLAYTRPLVAYVLEKGHRRECQRNDWCFLCEFQTHVERTSQSLHPFSPMNILSRLPNIGGNLGYGKQEDAHEFMRFAIDMMQSVCLDEFGGEKSVHPSYQETTLIQHIFGGRLRSQVICAECNNVSNQFENLMDLTVEIHGDAGSLEECLDQFTAKEWLHGDNMYKCDGCNAYVMAWKRLTIERAPNILTIALKRFQSGRFGKLNKRVTFPETLDLNPYMSELENGNDVYKLYAVIVHVDMLNASFFGHYICYVKDFHGTWYRIDDCKVARVDVDEVLSQGAYMLLYSRICARPSCLLPTELLKKEESENVKVNGVDPSLKQSPVDAMCTDCPFDSGHPLSANALEDAREENKIVFSDPSLPIVKDVELQNCEELPIAQKELAFPIIHDNQSKATDTSLIDSDSLEIDAHSSQSPSICDVENACRGSETDVNSRLLRMLHEESSDAHSCRTFEECCISCDTSATAITTDEVRDEVNSANATTSMPENVGNGNALPSSDDMQNAAKKSNDESSTAKFKPIFAPGFLEKRPRRKSSKPKEKAATQLVELTPESHLNNHTREAEESRSLCENGGVMKLEKPHIVHENGKSSTEFDIGKSHVNGNCIVHIEQEKPHIMHENGMSSIESDVCKSRINGNVIERNEAINST